MTRGAVRRRRGRAWSAVVMGAALGFLVAAIAFALASSWLAPRGNAEVAAVPTVVERVELFRLPSGGTHEMFLVPAGPDGTGEPRLSSAVFPSETPPRELASLLLANVAAAGEPWTVDLATTPLRCRATADGAWETLRSLDAESARLPPSDRLRLRGLGAGVARVTLEPSSMRQVLVALPPGRRIADLTDVQWGDVPLLRDAMELERVRRFREDPAAVTMGR